MSEASKDPNFPFNPTNTFAFVPADSAANDDWEASRNDKLIDSIYSAVDAPPDRPNQQSAIAGLVFALKAARAQWPSVKKHADGLLIQIDARPESTSPANESGSVEPLRRRLGQCRMYAVLLLLARQDRSSEHVQLIAARVGAHVMRRLIDSRARASSVSTTSYSALSMLPIVGPASNETLSRENKRAEREVGLFFAALSEAPAASLAYFQHPAPMLVPKQDPEEKLARAMRARCNAVRGYASAAARAGAFGTDTLSPAAVREAGVQLMERVECGDEVALIQALEVITNVPAATLRSFPVQATMEQDCAARIDLQGGRYIYRLQWLDRGARPEESTKELYLACSQVCGVPLPKPVVEELRKRWHERPDASLLADLVAGNQHHPRLPLLPGNSPGHRQSVNRLRQSLPALLLAKGHTRWPVSLALSQPFLVSVGRRAYGACPVQKIEMAISEAYIAMGWPATEFEASENLVGAAVVPTDEAIKDAFAWLARRADARTLAGAETAEQIAQALNRLAQYCSLALALALALRNSVTYGISMREIERDGRVRVGDKQVRAHVSVPHIPVPAQMMQLATQWSRALEGAVVKLRSMHTDDARALADCINVCLESGAGLMTFGAGAFSPAGTRTWMDALPSGKRLVGNFARHFWAHRLCAAAVPQRAIDILLRHQAQGAEPGIASDINSTWTIIDELSKAMDRAYDSLDLTIPRELAHVE